MGMKSFLIKFDNINQVIKFFIWRKYLANLVCKYYDDDNNNIEYIEMIIKDNVPCISYEKNDYGDFDIYLLGFKFWAGGIWGLVSTYSVGEITFELIVHKILKCYYSRLSDIDFSNTNYNKIDSIFLNNYYYNQNLIKASEIYLDLYYKYKLELYNYDYFIEKYKLKDIDENKCISFYSKKIINIFNIKNI